jgi:hypothetical protein
MGKICLAKKILKNLKKGVAFFKFIAYNRPRCPGVAQLVARLTGGQEAVSSSLATRTMKRTSFVRSAFFLFSFCIFNFFKKILSHLNGSASLDRIVGESAQKESATHRRYS